MIPLDTLPLVTLAIDQVRIGATDTKACRHVGLTLATFRRALLTHQELREMYESARQESADAMADALAEPFSHEMYGETDVQKAALMSKNIQWLLDKRARATYGAKVDVTHTHRADETLLAALERGRQAALTGAPPVVDAEFVEIEPAMDPEVHRLIYG